ncbi:diguanylate cyclase (GGDEF) domain-containing protein [Peptoclostridium litorale DSM 5388]|uniref:GGDEF domain-containing protein n=1 Tax=Peptoclostridium litorale DSM 5388 TaxID=1121324 RepID=A0A069RH43_PEPLI|nr:GGDEF domain-containing protein [Peptoclostridium litorale]KDR95490.1 GGDEF domain-containing protein [Peptoclostridium litorale DSM 5388]SIO17589.1 diguanylate cyclase (GGDEF) domain-containing protein [Peptoclostridium litorale DSM 5388]
MQLYIDENKKLTIILARDHIEKSGIERDSKVFVIEKKGETDFPALSEHEEYTMIIKIRDSLMPRGERLLVIDFKGQRQLVKEWKEAFASISGIIESVMQWIRVNRENKKLISKLKTLSETDKLTGIYNRMVLDRVLLKQTKSYERYGERCSIMIMDIDHFKRVNDTYGHNVGDKVLCEMARLLKRNTRNTDVVGRWGGEEFLIICEHTELGKAMILAETLREKTEDHSFGQAGSLTASFGVSTFCDGMTVEQVVGKADEALYKAKTEGRNRISD